MDIVLHGGEVFLRGARVRADVKTAPGFLEIAPEIFDRASDMPIDVTGKYVFPGFADVHAHLRDPGFSSKETMETGTSAAARGGFTSVCAMPNVNPVPDDSESLEAQERAIARGAWVRVYPYGAITHGQKGEALSDMDALSGRVVAFSDDGRGVQSEDVMRAAMEKAKSLDKMIVAHCEDDLLVSNGRSREAEYKQLERDLRLAGETGCRYHACHLSCLESVDLIRRAKDRGLDVSCETAPHYLLLSDKQIEDDGRFKMNPPIRGEKDRLALIEGLKDGAIDMIATDHAPHTAREKARGFSGSVNGVVGLECAFPVLYTGLVRAGILSLKKLIELMSVNPRKRFGIGGESDLTVFNLDAEYEIDPEKFASMGRSTPFQGMRVFGECVLTLADGKIAYRK